MVGGCEGRAGEFLGWRPGTVVSLSCSMKWRVRGFADYGGSHGSGRVKLNVDCVVPSKSSSIHTAFRLGWLAKTVGN